MAKVLVVEDDVTLANLIAEVLSADDHDVDVLNNGQQAAVQICSGQYELAVLDWDLPEKSGPEICRAFRDSGGRSPVLMLTGRDKVSDKEAGFDAGADDYLTKPFSLKELRARIKALLRRSTDYALPIEKQKAPSVEAPAATERQAQSAGDALVGTTIDGRYKILEPLARGGMGLVYKATHERLRRNVAVKVLYSSVFYSDPDAVRRLGQEAIAVGQLSHPNVVTVYDFGVTASGLPYLVMDFVEGISLSEVLNKDVRLSVARTIQIFSQVCDGLTHAHNAGLVHRDIKPSNIMITNDGSVKVLDFGIAKVLPSAGLDVEKITQTGDALGTCYYMSPEQCRGESIDHRADVYAAGCMLYEMLTGLPPFKAPNPLATIHLHVKSAPPKFSESRPDLTFPDGLETVVMKALEKNPGQRHQSMDELKNELLDFQSSN
jgi:DNA-binding response OmpR family regulator